MDIKISAFLTEDELRKFSSVNDIDLNNTLQWLRLYMGDCWFIQEVPYVKKKWLGKKESGIIYTLYYKPISVEGTEVQIINFMPEHRLISINTIVSKQILMSYLMGLTNGLDFCFSKTGRKKLVELSSINLSEDFKGFM